MNSTLQFHTLAFELLGRPVVVSAEAVSAIEKCEKSCGRKLPAAVKEWYSIAGANDALTQRNQAGGAQKLADFLSDFSKPDTKRVRFFGPWNEDTEYGAMVLLDGNSDPEVEVNPPDTPQSFSQFVLNTLWWQLTLEQLHIKIYGPNYFPCTIARSQLEHFSQKFKELPRVIEKDFKFSDPQSTPFDFHTLRFYRPGQRVEIQCKGDPSSALVPAAFVLTADSEEQLFQLYAESTPCHGTRAEIGPADRPDHAEIQTRFHSMFPPGKLLG